MSAARGRQGVGSAAQEAVELLAAAEQWARSRAGRLLDDEHLATGSPECTSCPVCQGVGALRAVRPETVEHLLDAAASLVAALRTAVAEPAGRGSGGGGATGVERIDVTGDVTGDGTAPGGAGQERAWD